MLPASSNRGGSTSSRRGTRHPAQPTTPRRGYSPQKPNKLQAGTIKPRRSSRQGGRWLVDAAGILSSRGGYSGNQHRRGGAPLTGRFNKYQRWGRSNFICTGLNSSGTGLNSSGTGLNSSGTGLNFNGTGLNFNGSFSIFNRVI